MKLTDISQAADRPDEVAELRAAQVKINQLIIDYIDEDRLKSQSMAARIDALEKLLKNYEKTLDAFESIIRDL